MDRDAALWAVLAERLGDRVVAVRVPPSDAGFYFATIEGRAGLFAAVCVPHVVVMSDHLPNDSFGQFALGLAMLCERVLEAGDDGDIADRLVAARLFVESVVPESGLLLHNVFDL